MAQLAIKDKDGRIYQYASVKDGNLQLEYEVYGRGEGSRSSESIYTVNASEFAKIGEKYGKEGDADILSILQNVVDTNRAKEFSDDLSNGFITIGDHFVWVSFDD
jgi:hypothetical protein